MLEGSATVTRIKEMSARREMGPRSANSGSRSRLSCSSPNPEIIHWRTFPERWRTRFPTLFDAGFGLHQMSFSGSKLRHLINRGMWYVSMECRDSFRNNFVNSGFAGFMNCFPQPRKEFKTLRNIHAGAHSGISARTFDDEY